MEYGGEQVEEGRAEDADEAAGVEAGEALLAPDVRHGLPHSAVLRFRAAGLRAQPPRDRFQRVHERYRAQRHAVKDGHVQVEGPVFGDAQAAEHERHQVSDPEQVQRAVQPVRQQRGPEAVPEHGEAVLRTHQQVALEHVAILGAAFGRHLQCHQHVQHFQRLHYNQPCESTQQQPTLALD